MVGLHRGSNGAHTICLAAVLVAIGDFVITIGGDLVVLKFVPLSIGGKYGAGSAVGVGFGQRGSSGTISGPHFKGPLQYGSKEPVTIKFQSHYFSQRREFQKININ